MTKQAEKDAQMLHQARVFAPNDTMIRELLELIGRRDEKSTAMLALLEQWVKEFPCPVCAGRGTGKFWNQQEVIDDTRQLLKEAKVE